MSSLKEAVDDFLNQHRIAIAGVSRDPKQPANLIYRTSLKGGHEMFPVNPNADARQGAAVTQKLPLS